MFRSPSKNDAFLGIKKQVDELLSSSEQFMVHLQEKTISKEDRNVIIKQINTNIVATEDLLSCSERLKAVDKEGSKSEERIAYVENSRNRINQIKTALVSPISRKVYAKNMAGQRNSAPPSFYKYNEGTQLIQQQKKLMDEQDESIDILVPVVNKLRSMSEAIKAELTIHNKILDKMDGQVDNANYAIIKNDRASNSLLK